ncbi:MAG TPA: neutral zinc metallopeptidase [Myxococcota bacterium]|nr:neutral zinc metallopeptidase [Myxococcota bacterium]
MKWEGERESDQVEDRRGMSIGRGGAVIGGGGLLLILLFSALTGTDPRQVLEIAQGVSDVASGPGQGEAGKMGAPSDEGGKFASVVLASTEDVWGEIFSEHGKRYQPPRLVLFSDMVQSACGTAQSAVGPFYCPNDSQVYLDLSFFHELERRFGAPGDFARAYVIAHEVGHHVQNLLGIAEKVSAAQSRGSRTDANELSVRMELQADCLAGVWGKRANQERKWLEPGDVEAGLAAAAAIGDDTLQRQAGGAVAPESWTHGSSAMRVKWLKAGLESGDLNACDTFGSDSLL